MQSSHVACTGATPTLATAVITSTLWCDGGTSVTVDDGVTVDGGAELTINTPLAVFNGDFRVLSGGRLIVQNVP